MTIKNNSVVTLEYHLTNKKGEVLDSSRGSEPLLYLHGSNNIIPGLESALNGKKVDDEFSVNITAKDAYGERDEDLASEVPREHFEGVDVIKAGMQFETETEGGPMLITVVEVDDKVVKVDANHPLAGEELNFDVKVLEIRDATEVELEHGHVHGPGGHHH